MIKNKEKAKLLCTGVGLILTSLIIPAHSQSSLDSLGCNYLEEIFSKVNDTQHATAIYNQALRNLELPSQKNAERLKRLEADITDIMTETERTVYKGLRSPSEKIIFFQRFWRSRDLNPATETNERLVEHYARLAYARDKYSFFDARGYDDRGQIYVQYGSPDNYVIDNFHPSCAPVETWVYYSLGPPVTFDFIDNSYGFRLTTRIDKAIKVESTSKSASDAYLTAMDNLLSKRSYLSPAYAKAYADFQELLTQHRLGKYQLVGTVLNQYNSTNQSMQVNLPKSYSTVLINISDLPFVVHLSRFKVDAQHHNLAIVYGLKIADLKLDSGNSVKLALAAAIKDTNLITLASQQDTLHLTSMSFDQAGELIGTLQYKIPSGHYFVLLDLNNPAHRQRGLKDFSLVIGNYPTGRLHLSSVIFAKKVAPTDSVTSQRAFTRHGLAVVPYPFPILQRSAPMFIYFEIYDLQRDVAGETFYDVEYEVNAPAKKGFASLLESLNPFGKSGGSISVSDTRRGKAVVEPTYLQLDFSQLRSGKYDLIVRVTDKVANVTKESKLDFELE